MQAAHQVARYDPDRPGTYHLSILSTPGAQAWCVHDTSDGACLAIHSDQGEALPAQDVLPKDAVSVTFIGAPELSTLVPESALVPGSEMEHLTLVHGALPTGLMRDEPIEPIGARCVYLHDERTEHAILQRFPAARPLSLRGLLVQRAIDHGRSGAALILHRIGDRMDLAIADRGRLLLSNSYHVGGATDTLFHVLFAVEQVSMVPDRIKVYAGGPAWGQEEQYLLRRYLVDCAAAVPSDRMDLAALGVQAPERWLALFEQVACA
ncbi:MAG: DUF3822 family protein [Flavobacteriales bacterium]|nr:DUF3822 family protein [Flavobacteriales bacterium]